MKNLYKWLGLNGPASSAEIGAALQRAQLDKRADELIRFILLDPDRKAIYDRSWIVLERIGRMRSNLGLKHTTNWLASFNAEFEEEPAPNPSRLDRLRPYFDRKKKYAPHAGRGVFWGGASLLVVVFIVGLMFTYFQKDSFSSGRPRVAPAEIPLNNQSTPSNSPASNLPPTDNLPPTGIIDYAFDEKGVAPLELIATKVLPPGAPPDLAGHFFVKLFLWDSEQVVITLFLRDGDRIKLDVPLGSYGMKYAVGSDWLGAANDQLFGPATRCVRVKNRFDFARTPEGYEGYTLELVFRPDGNLRNPQIPRESF